VVPLLGTSGGRVTGTYHEDGDAQYSALCRMLAALSCC